MSVKRTASGLTVVTHGRRVDMADLDYAVEGPDRRFQGHGPGCRCGDIDCPWYRGERAAHVYREEMTSSERLADYAQVVEAFRSPPPPPI